MTNSTYGNYQTPSSRPPEPPYRTGSQEGQASAPTTPIEQVPPAVEAYEPAVNASGYDVSSSAADDGFQTTAPAGGQAQPAYGESRFGDTQSMPRTESVSQASYQPTNFVASQQHAAPRKSGGAGKTFLFGFLGALVACALALGGFSMWNARNASAASASTVVGTTDSSVINAVDEGQTLSEAVAAKALPSVVAVYNYQEQASSYGYGYGYGTGNGASGDLAASGMGSGVVISDDGYIITNYHVVEGADKLTVTVEGEERDATFVGGDSSSDVAVLKVDDTDGLVTADIGDSDDLVIGEWVMTVGAPLGLEQSVATGVVSATNRSTIMSDSDSNTYGMFTNASPEYTYYPNMIQTDAVINPGNSGGALVDADGKLIGINTMISSYSGDYAGVGFAIPVNYAIGIAEQVIAGKTPTHAILGVSISQVNPNIAQRYNLSADEGAYISVITDGTGAADSDLQVGDIITQIDDTKVTSTTDVTLEVREHNPGDTVKVTVDRNGETHEVDVVLGSDENIASSTGDEESGESDESERGSGRGNGNAYGYGNGGSGTNSQNIEDLLRMLGM